MCVRERVCVCLCVCVFVVVAREEWLLLLLLVSSVGSLLFLDGKGEVSVCPKCVVSKQKDDDGDKPDP